MKLLIVCQTIDKNHPILGFFHRWVEEFAQHFEHIHVIALQEGEHNLPKNVTVHSLGKENVASKFKQLSTFYSLLSKLHREYDAVFVHMNPEYIVLAGWMWRLTGKKIGLWYNHTIGSFWLRIAQPFTNTVFHTSPFAYTARYKNALRMPAGIDTNVFKPHPEVVKIPRSIYFQGRIAPAKNVHILLEACALLHSEGVVDILTLVGPENTEYTDTLRKKYSDLIQSGVVNFKGPIQNNQTPQLYAAHSLSVNLTADGNYDKTVLESMSCGTPAIVASAAFDDIVDSVYTIDSLSVQSLYSTIKSSMELPVDSSDLHGRVMQKHSLVLLGDTLKECYE